MILLHKRFSSVLSMVYPKVTGMSNLLAICLFLSRPAWTLLVECPTTAAAPSMRYSMKLSVPGQPAYAGTLLLSDNGNFVFLAQIPDVISPLSVMQGTWLFSSCTNTVTFNGHTFYFLDFPKLSISNVTCSYACGMISSATRSCLITYTLKSLKATGTYSVAFELSIPVD